MNIKLKLFFFILILPISILSQKYKVGLCICATNKYIQFVEPLLESARKYFLTSHDVNFFIFTDTFLNTKNDTRIIYLKHKPWPLSTMQRFQAYYESKDMLKDMNYVFACDADMKFMNDVSEEILSERVGTLHPLFYDDLNAAKKEFETNKISLARVEPEEAQNYFAGGFYGGSFNEFINIVKTCSNNIKIDFNKKYIPKWHDESYLNKYFVDNPPTLKLSPSYCYPQNYWKWIKNKPFNFNNILMALDKDYQIR